MKAFIKAMKGSAMKGSAMKGSAMKWEVKQENLILNSWKLWKCFKYKK